MLMCHKPLNSMPLWAYLSPRRRSCVSFSRIVFINRPTHLSTQLRDASRILTTQMWVFGINMCWKHAPDYSRYMQKLCINEWCILYLPCPSFADVTRNTYCTWGSCFRAAHCFLVKRFSLLRFLYSRGYLNHQKLQGGNLLKCAEAIFTHEIYAGESPP